MVVGRSLSCLSRHWSDWNVFLGVLTGRSFFAFMFRVAIAPHTGTAVRGGLTFREAHFVAESLAETGQLVSMDMVEVNVKVTDELDSDGDETVELGLALIGSTLGNSII